MKGKAATRLARRLRVEGELCGRGKMPSGASVLLRRGVVRRSQPSHGGAWCLSLKKRRSA